MVVKPKADWPVLGHQKIINFLQTSIVHQKISHAYLFVGPGGIGKKTVALNFIKSIICWDKNHDNWNMPCQTCPVCQKFDTSKFVDLHQLSAQNERVIGIDEIRSLVHFLNLRPYDCNFKFAIIEADQLSLSASNSFLKTLEEPTSRTILILLSENEEKLPKTIVSRCQVLRFSRISNQEIYDYLKEKKACSKLAKELSFYSEGSPGKALSLLNSAEHIADLKDRTEQVMTLLQSDIEERFELISDFFPSKTSAIDTRKHNEEIYLIILNLLHDILKLKVLSNKVPLKYYFLKNRLISFSQKISWPVLINAHNTIIQSQKLILQNINPRLIFENILFSL